MAKQSMLLPWPEALRLRNLIFMVGVCFVVGILTTYPLLLSSIGFVLLMIGWRRAVGAQEVAHA